MDERTGSGSRGSRIRDLRRARGLTQAQLAQACRVTVTFISLLERDEKTPGRELLLRLAQSLATSADYIETGEASVIEQAEQARLDLWPELIYLVANHIIIPRCLDPVEAIPDHEGLRLAVERAWNSQYLCDYMAWAGSAEGQATGKTFAGKRLLERLIRCAPWEGRDLGHAVWIELARPKLRGPTTSNPHESAAGRHAVTGAVGECFVWDIDAVFALHPAVIHGLVGFGMRRRGYRNCTFRGAFVEAAFPEVFWMASRQWTDRRMAAWLGFLDMPADLYAPLARIARQYDSATGFRRSAKMLFDHVVVHNCDEFLGLFPDIYALSGPYQRRFSEQVFEVEPSVDESSPSVGDPVLARRRIRRKWPSQQRLDYVFSEGDDKMQDEVEAYLKDRTSDIRFLQPGITEWIGKGRRPKRRKPRLSGKPPETLP